MSMLFSDNEFTEWLEDTVRYLYEKSPNGVAFVAQSDDGTTYCSYYNCGCCRKLEFASHIQLDAIRDVAEAEASSNEQTE